MKHFKLVISDEAINDFIEAFNYYKTISIALEKKFHSSTNITFRDLMKNPFYQIRYDDFRLRVIKKFPYVICNAKPTYEFKLLSI